MFDHSALSLFLAGAQCCLCGFLATCRQERHFWVVKGERGPQESFIDPVALIIHRPETGNAMPCPWKRPRLDPIWIHADPREAMILSIY